ncbi:ferrous iron transport protein A [Methanosarcinales archaeon]|nr:MAG: ferrous iron transport protein A [Methanosarcinales archaeon]
MEKRLSELNFDEEGAVKEIDESLVRQVAGMGVRIGKNIKMATKQPMKGPVVVEVDKSVISLGRSTAEKIVVEVKK